MYYRYRQPVQIVDEPAGVERQVDTPTTLALPPVSEVSSSENVVVRIALYFSCPLRSRKAVFVLCDIDEGESVGLDVGDPFADEAGTTLDLIQERKLALALDVPGDESAVCLAARDVFDVDAAVFELPDHLVGVGLERLAQLDVEALPEDRVVQDDAKIGKLQLLAHIGFGRILRRLTSVRPILVASLRLKKLRFWVGGSGRRQHPPCRSEKSRWVSENPDGYIEGA